MSFLHEMTTAYNDMLDVNASLGFYRNNYEFHISPFIDFCADNYPNASEITKNMIDQWLVSKSFNADNTRRIAIINIRHFTRYLNATEKHANIPSSEYNIKARRYQPYIFNDWLFDEIDSLKNRRGSEASNPNLTLPVVFRLELCCGMRPGEPLNLRVEDVNLKTGDVFIRRSKRGKDRHIIMSEEMRQLCATYDGFVGKREWFFPYTDGGKIPIRWVMWNFNKAWNKTGLPVRFNKPRPYDLRHSFATQTLMRWVDEGRVIMTHMPYFSTYMAHVNMEETLYLCASLAGKNKSFTWHQLGYDG